MAKSEVIRIVAQMPTHHGSSRVASSTSSFPIKPDIGGRPAAAMAAAKNIAAISPLFWIFGRSVSHRSPPRRAAIMSAIRNIAAPVRVEWMV